MSADYSNDRTDDRSASMPHDVPSAAELIESVREWIENDVLAATEGRVKFHARVAANVLAIVEREMRLGPAQAVAHAERLASLNVGSDAELAELVRSRTFAGSPTDLRAALLSSVIDKLEVANPRYLEP